MASNNSAKHLHITGKVQGVYYRAWTKEQAGSLGITGWVRNRNDGTVKAIIEGPKDALNTLLQKCHEGPPSAKVDGIETEDTPPRNFSNFEVKPTA